MEASRLLETYYHIQARFAWWPGVTRKKRPTPIVVTLTTVPSRYDRVHLAIVSLLNQTFKPDHVILWVGERPDGSMPDLPESLLRLRARGLEICARPDVGPHTKLIHALREYRDAIHVTADDDRYYPRQWLEGLYRSYLEDPSIIHCYRAHTMLKDGNGRLRGYSEWEFYAPGKIGPSMDLFPTGTGGVLYPPNCLHEEVFNERAFRELCPRADDIWFKAMAMMNNVPCKKVQPHFQEHPVIRGTQEERLWTHNTTGNDPQIEAVFERYGLYSRIS